MTSGEGPHSHVRLIISEHLNTMAAVVSLRAGIAKLTSCKTNFDTL